MRERGKNEDFKDAFWGFPNPFSPWPLVFKEKCSGGKKQGYNLGTILPRRKSHFFTQYFKKGKEGAPGWLSS